ncbi:MAG: DUF6340 family protein [Bacteroidales bacterium]
MKTELTFSGKNKTAFTAKGLLIVVILVFSACSRTVYVPVLEPAPVDIGSHIKTVAVVNRTTPENPDEVAVESVLTGSMPGLNREAAQRAIEGMVRTLESSPRYSVIRTAERLTTPEIPGNWPPPVSWSEVESLISRYKSDAILVLESFDSDFIVTKGAVSNPSAKGGLILGRKFYAEGVAGIKLGFRIYDLQYKTIADEYMFDHHQRWQSEGNALQMVVGGLIDHRQAVNEASFQSGIIYAERISPRWIRLNRDFFTRGRGDPDFKVGVRRATVNDWEGAREAWHKSVNSRKRKTAGRSAYNLALMYEIAGELDVAREWAQYSYSDYGIRKARKYLYKLERRIRIQRIAEEQFR